MKLWKKICLTILLVVCLIVVGGLVVAWNLNTPTTKEGIARIEASPQYGDGQFVNIEPQAPMEISWQRVTEVLEADERSVPGVTIPVIPIQPERLSSPPADGFRMAWIGHASVLVEIDGKRILTDPVFSERVSPFTNLGPKRFHPTPISLENLKGIDAVVITHNHYDHLDKSTVRHLAKQETRFFVPLGIGAQLLAWDVPASQIEEMDWWQEAKLGELRVIATPSRHYSNRSVFDFKKTLWASWSIIGPENRVFVSGDTGYSKAFSQIGEKLGPFDATIIKIGAYGPGQSWRDIHMTPDEAMQVHKDVGGKLMLPVHWGTFNLAYHAWDEPIILSVAAANKAGVALVTPKVGEFIHSESGNPSLNWWKNLK